jgi:glucokinase
VILAGDIGGTKTVVALYERSGEGLAQCHEATFASAEHESLEEILREFLRERDVAGLEAACFGVAGPVIDGKAKTTNLPWILDESSLAEASGSPRVSLLNDLEAAAYGMLRLRADEQAVLNEGVPRSRPGNVAVIAAGTGLGQAMLIWDGQRHHAVACEGGHVSFAPRSEREIELLRFLRAELGGRVSTERVLSGPGLRNVYRFVRASGGDPEPEWLGERLRGEDPSAVIAEVALSGRDSACGEALEIFCSVYGAVAGDLALSCLALGGVFVGGGIAPQILSALEAGAFLRAFTDKGRFAELLRDLPVRVALNPRTPLIGAAHHALQS